MTNNNNNRVFAHSTSREDKSNWELLTDHASNVGERATEFASGFDTIGLARLSGVLHDLGKVKPRVQARIGGDKNIHEPHSGEGARYLIDKPKIFGRWGKLIAYCIAGHHTGLANGIGETAGKPSTPLCERLRQAKRVDLPEGLVLPDLQPGMPPPLQGITDRDPDLNFRLHFFTRMLFSALVDADFLETERFYNEVEGRASERGWTGNRDSLLANLNAYLVALSKADSDVNRLRQEVLKHVRSNATNPPGLFTLTVPTGGGKTLASLAFALEHAQQYNLDRVIYVIPYMSIVEQTADVFRRALIDDDAVLEHHSSFDWSKTDDEIAAERLKLATQNWDRPVVVTTAVQFFESLYANRTSKCRKLHRLGRSVIILDEAQTLPLRLFRPCLAAIKELVRGYGASVVLCTATQPAVMKEDGFGHREGLDNNQVRELAPDPQRLYDALHRVRINNVGPLCDEDLAGHIADTRCVLVIVDNRKHARALFERIRDLPGSYHLTTTMTPSHRRDVLDEVRECLDTEQPVRLIATSLIEAGVDVDFPVVYRAVAGIDSIAQAAGRCNREGRLEEKGQVFVFEQEPTFPAPEDVKQFAQIGLGILREFDDPLSLEAVREYFSRLLWQRDQYLDDAMIGRHKGIMRALEKAGNQFDFPFADIAHAFRIIKDGALPVIIRDGSFGVPPELLEELRYNPHAGSIARRLQPYQVQVPDRIRNEMLGSRAASFWREEKFEDQFVMLENTHLYDDRAGLHLDEFTDLGFMEG